jgi:hypothetical protein
MIDTIWQQWCGLYGESFIQGVFTLTVLGVVCYAIIKRWL